jgi:hypothetical protein
MTLHTESDRIHLVTDPTSLSSVQKVDLKELFLLAGWAVVLHAA